MTIVELATLSLAALVRRSILTFNFLASLDKETGVLALRVRLVFISDYIGSKQQGLLSWLGIIGKVVFWELW